MGSRLCIYIALDPCGCGCGCGCDRTKTKWSLRLSSIILNYFGTNT